VLPVRATMEVSALSFPSPSRSTDETAPGSPAAAGMVCPKCHRRFDEDDPARVCPYDQTSLVGLREMAEAVGDPMLGRTLDGRFTVLARLGAGSMGTVYRARQHAMGREVAIKILRSDRAVDDSAKGRFLREARANSLLVSPHTVTVFDFGQTASGELFLAMELLLGESLGQRLTRVGRMPANEAVDTVRQALRSLSEAHAKGIIHRDLKPDNLFFARVATGGHTEEIVKVLDFGVAKMMGDVGEPINAVETQAGTVFGTPRYMSPEQAQGKALDGRSDLYSLGVILYHMLTGRAPFTDDDAVVVMARHIKTPAPRATSVCPEARIPPDLDAFLVRLLSKEPADRPFDAEAMMQEIAKLDESGLAATSGIRVSVVGDPWRGSGPAPSAGLSAGLPSPGKETLQAAGIAPRRRGRSTAIGFALALAVVGVVFAVSAIPRGQAGPPPAPQHAPIGAAAVTADIPPPAPEPPPSAAIPSIAADDLPRVNPAASAGSPDLHTGAGSSGRHHHPTPAPTASSSHYGYLE